MSTSSYILDQASGTDTMKQQAELSGLLSAIEKAEKELVEKNKLNGDVDKLHTSKTLELGEVEKKIEEKHLELSAFSDSITAMSDAADTKKALIESQEQKITDLGKQIQALESDITSKKVEKEQLLSDNKKVSEALKSQSEELKQVDSLIVEKIQELAVLTGQITKAKADVSVEFGLLTEFKTEREAFEKKTLESIDDREREASKQRVIELSKIQEAQNELNKKSEEISGLVDRANKIIAGEAERNNEHEKQVLSYNSEKQMFEMTSKKKSDELDEREAVIKNREAALEENKRSLLIDIARQIKAKKLEAEQDLIESLKSV